MNEDLVLWNTDNADASNADFHEFILNIEYRITNANFRLD